MGFNVCTLFEKDYHFGLVALHNSLYQHGFRGTLWAGYRGVLPRWAHGGTQVGNAYVLPTAADCHIAFVKLGTDKHFTNCKPRFMLDIFETLDPTADGLLYFDPDIFVCASWAYFSAWLELGVAICEDNMPYLPSTHPARHAWRGVLAKLGHGVASDTSRYYNAGFIGLRRDYIDLLRTWEQCLLDVEAEWKGLQYHEEERQSPFYLGDQDAFNIALMASDYPMSTLGPEGMGFTGGRCRVMAHRIGARKPWNRSLFLSFLKNRRSVSNADLEFWKHAQLPISAYEGDRVRHCLRTGDLVLVKALRRVSAFN